MQGRQLKKKYLPTADSFESTLERLLGGATGGSPRGGGAGAFFFPKIKSK